MNRQPSSFYALRCHAYHWVYDGATGTSEVYAFDGTTWTEVSSNTPTGNLGWSSYVAVVRGLAYHWVYDSVTGTRQLYSFDGAAWTEIDSNTPAGNLGGYVPSGSACSTSSSYLGSL